MRILMTRENFSKKLFELQNGDEMLEFTGGDDSFALPYSEIKDFCITQNQRDKMFFSLIGNNRLYEGQILESTDLETFAESLKEKLHGIINIQVKK